MSGARNGDEVRIFEWNLESDEWPLRPSLLGRSAAISGMLIIQHGARARGGESHAVPPPDGELGRGLKGVRKFSNKGREFAPPQQRSNVKLRTQREYSGQSCQKAKVQNALCCCQLCCWPRRARRCSPDRPTPPARALVRYVLAWIHMRAARIGTFLREYICTRCVWYTFLRECICARREWCVLT